MRWAGWQFLRHWGLWVVVLLLLAAGVRFHLLGAQSLWNDEGNSYVQATRSFSEIAANAGRDIHPPGYYWLLALWRALTGQTEFALRALSAFASLLTIALVYAIGQRLGSRLIGFSAGLFVALNSFQVYYAQEARMYALLTLWVALAFWLLWGFLQAAPQRRLRWGIALALVNAAGLWTQYAYPFFLLVQGVTFCAWLWTQRRSDFLRPLALYTGINLLAIALYLPWLPTALQQISTWPNTGQPIELNAALGIIGSWFTLGITSPAIDASWVAVGLFLLLFGLRVSPQPQDWLRLSSLVLWAALPVTLFLMMGLFRESNLKFLLPAQVGFALLMGRGVWALWHLLPNRRTAWIGKVSRLAGVAGAFGLSLNLWSGLMPLYHDPAFHRDDYRAIVAAIESDAQPGDVVILNAPNQQEVFGYYYQGQAPVIPLPAGLGGDDAATAAETNALIEDYQRVFAVYWGEAERDPKRIVETTLNTQAYTAQSDWYGDVRLVQYVTPAEMTLTEDTDAQFGPSIRLVRYALNAAQFQPGGVLQIRLDWLTDSPLKWRYKVFVQLIGPDGLLVAQHDSEPAGGQALTTTWPVNTTIEDRHALILPADLPAGTYQLITGLYELEDPDRRLLVAGESLLTLAEVRITGP
jgi:mannosyltransferase